MLVGEGSIPKNVKMWYLFITNIMAVKLSEFRMKLAYDIQTVQDGL